MTETVKNLYSFLLSHKDNSLTEIDCLAVEGVTPQNVLQLLKILENDNKISLDDTYIHYGITVL